MTPSTLTPLVAYQSIPLGQIVPSPYQARKDFDPAALQTLADSMKAEGLLEPIIVRLVSRSAFSVARDNAEPETRNAERVYELISGERRLRAAKLLGWEVIEAKIIQTSSDAEAAAKGMVENLQRSDLNPIEEAEGFQTLNQLDPKYWTQDQIAKVAGRSRVYITQSLGILGMAEEVKADVRRLTLNRSQAVEIMRLPMDKQAEAGEKAKDLSWKETRQLVNRILSGPPRPTPIHVITEQGFHFTEVKDRIVFTGTFGRTADLDSEVAKFRGALMLWVSQHPYTVQMRAERGVRSAEEGSPHKEHLLPHPTPRIPHAVSEMAELQALVPQGPSAVYTWIFGPASPYVTEFKGMTWKDLHIDPTHAIEQTLAGIKVLQKVEKERQ